MAPHIGRSPGLAATFLGAAVVGIMYGRMKSSSLNKKHRDETQKELEEKHKKEVEDAYNRGREDATPKPILERLFSDTPSKKVSSGEPLDWIDYVDDLTDDDFIYTEEQ